MRRDTKLAIVVAVVFVGVGAWYVLKDRLAGSPKGEPTTPVAKEPTTKPATVARNLSKPRDTSTPSRTTDAHRTLRDHTSSPGPLAATSRERTVGENGLTPRPASSGFSSVAPNRPVAAPPVTPGGEPSGLSATTTRPAMGMGAAERPRPTLAPAITPSTEEQTSSISRIGPAGTASVADARPPTGAAIDKKPAKQPTTHVVARGDTFTSLAVKYLGHAKYAKLIAKANPDVDPRRMAVGAKLTIPPAPEDASPSATVASPTPPAGPGLASPTPVRPLSKPRPVPTDRAYTVKAGEGWYTLAQRFLGDGTRWTELYELNKERVPRNPHNIPPGAIIELPKEAKRAAEPTTQPAQP